MFLLKPNHAKYPIWPTEIFFILQVPQSAEDVAVYGSVRHRDHEEPEGRHGSARVFCWVQKGCDQSPQYPRMQGELLFLKVNKKTVDFLLQ